MKWVLIAVAVGIGLVAIFMLRGIFRRESPDGSKTDVLPDVSEALKDKVRQAEEEALIARVEARVEAETQKKELEEISTIDDGAERRKRLAAMLRGL
jgi:hypothetical protein